MNEHCYVWDWIAEYYCHSAFEDEENFNDLRQFTLLLKTAISSLFYDEKILKEAQENLKCCQLNDTNKRILLTCVAIRAFTALEQNTPLVYLYEEELFSLKSMLSLIDNLKPCFDDIEQQHLLDKLWIITFQQFINQDSTRKLDESLNDVALHYGKNIPELLWSSSIPPRNAPICANNQDFISSVLDIIYKLHSLLKKPFLTKLQEKLDSHNKSQDDISTSTQAQSICEQTNAQFQLLKQLDSGSERGKMLKFISTPIDVIVHKNNITTSSADDDESFVTAESMDQSEASKSNIFEKSSQSISESTDSQVNKDNCAGSGLKDTTSNPSGIVDNNQSVQQDTSSHESDSSHGRVWSMLHDAYIIVGVEKYGVSAWSRIQKEFSFPFLNTGAHVRNRWRTMIKNGTVELYSDNTVKKISSRYNKYLRIARRRAERNVKMKEKTFKNSTSKDVLKGHESLHGHCVQINKTFLKHANSENSSPVFGGKKAWTTEEDANIILGVTKYGIGSWAKIKTQFTFSPRRTNVNLKDRWRTMLEKQLVTVSEAGKVINYSDDYKQVIELIRNRS